MAGYDYYHGFLKMVHHAKRAGLVLDEEFEAFTTDDLEQKILDMHEIEHSCDMVMHEVLEHLLKEFLPPIEREDIMSIVHAIDNVTDSIEEVLVSTYVFHIKVITENAKEFSKLINECVQALEKAVEELPNFKKSKTLKDQIILINDIEEKGDRLYVNTLRDLYSGVHDHSDVLKWSRIYNNMEKCLDSCEQVANVIETVVLKNN